jgi:hypothetical protein
MATGFAGGLSSHNVSGMRRWAAHFKAKACPNKFYRLGVEHKVGQLPHRNSLEMDKQAEQDIASFFASC